MARRSIGIVMNGVTGRMGYRQHLVRSVPARREQGGLTLADGTLIWPDPPLPVRDRWLGVPGVEDGADPSGLDLVHVTGHAHLR
jgi:hypothetical protein